MTFNRADITMVMRVGGTRCETGFSVIVAPTVPTLAVLAQRCYVAMGTALAPALSISVAFEECIASHLGQKGYYSGNRVGTSPSAAAAISTSILVSKIPVQGSAGRMYIPGLPETSLFTNGKLLPAYYQNVQATLEDFLLELDNRNVQMVMSRDGRTSDAVERLLVKPYCGRQDRRIVRGRGS